MILSRVDQMDMEGAIRTLLMELGKATFPTTSPVRVRSLAGRVFIEFASDTISPGSALRMVDRLRQLLMEDQLRNLKHGTD